MSRYVDEMTREELVEEVKDLLLRGVFKHEEVGDPTILAPPALRRGVKRLRLRMLVERRLGGARTARRTPRRSSWRRRRRFSSGMRGIVAVATPVAGAGMGGPHSARVGQLVNVDPVVDRPPPARRCQQERASGRSMRSRPRQ